MYERWCKRYGVEPFPVTEMILVFYCATRGIRVGYSTVLGDLAAIKSAMVDRNQLVDFTSFDTLRRLTRGLRRAKVTATDLIHWTNEMICKDDKLPLTIEMIVEIHEFVQAYFPGNLLLEMLDCAANQGVVAVQRISETVPDLEPNPRTTLRTGEVLGYNFGVTTRVNR